MNTSRAVTILRKIAGRFQPGIQERIFRAYRRALPTAGGAFPERIDLPLRYGRGLPERVVELLLARFSYAPGARVLDVGHANIMECHRRMLLSLPEPRDLTGIDIADPVYETSPLYRRSIKADITASGLPDRSFDLIWCISTLEHIGMDNSGYTASFATGEHMAAQALQEMVRLLAPHGGAIVTVPFGKFENHGWLINYDAERWQSLLSLVRPRAEVREWYFRHTSKGWKSVSADALGAVGYLDQQNAGAAGLAAAYIMKGAGGR